jgi:UDPglucose 6-dehydrogenase
MKIAVIGAGYVGSVTGAFFAGMGHSCVIIDIDSEKVKLIQSGNKPHLRAGSG